MTPEAFAIYYIDRNSFYEGEYGYCILGDDDGKELTKLIAQRDREILTKAAERVCKECHACIGATCYIQKAILTQLYEKEGS